MWTIHYNNTTILCLFVWNNTPVYNFTTHYNTFIYAKRALGTTCLYQIPELWDCSSIPAFPGPWSGHCCQRRRTRRAACGLWGAAEEWEPQGRAGYRCAPSYSLWGLDRNLSTNQKSCEIKHVSLVHLTAVVNKTTPDRQSDYTRNCTFNLET